MINNFTDLDCQMIIGVCAKNLKAMLLFVDFSETFDSVHRVKMDQILLAYLLPKEIVIARIIFYKNKKEMVHSPDDGIDFFDIVTEILW